MGVWRGIELGEVQLPTARLILRPLRDDDAPTVFAAMQHQRMHEFLRLPDPYTESDALGFVSEISHRGRQAGTGMEFGLVESGSRRLVGSAALRLPTEASRTAAEIGYAVYPDGQGHGFAAEAARALCTWAFEHEVERVEIRCAVANLVSARVALGAGFRFEGIARADVVTAQGAMDGAVFGRLPADSGKPVPPVVRPLPDGGLSDGVLTLRVRCGADLDATMAEQSDPLSRGWEFDDQPPHRAEWASILARAPLEWLVGPVLRMSMVDVATRAVAGSIQIRIGGPPQLGNVGYGVHPAFRGRGYAARALRLLTTWAFDTGGFGRLELGAKAANVVSQKAAAAGGFEPDGVLRGRLRNPNGTFSDEVRFAAVKPARPDWPRTQPTT